MGLGVGNRVFKSWGEGWVATLGVWNRRCSWWRIIGIRQIWFGECGVVHPWRLSAGTVTPLLQYLPWPVRVVLDKGAE